MKLNKIFTNILKTAANGKKVVNANYGIEDGYIYYIPDGHRMFRIPENDFLIDLKKAFPKKIPLTNAKKFFESRRDKEEAIKTNELKTINSGKNTLVKIQSKNNHAWINIDYLKEFNSDCTFKIVNNISPVFIYEYEECVGLILPVKVVEDSND